MHTIVSLIPNSEHVTNAGEQLRANGIAEEKIHILHRNADVWQQLNGRQQIHTAVKDALIGMMLGLVVGLLYGITAGILNCRLMGCPVATSLMMLALISIYWMAAGAFLGGVIGFDQLEQKLYGCLRTWSVTNTRKAYIPPADILAEVKQALQRHVPGDIDWVTFVGSGEPTLHSDIGRLIRQVKAFTDLPVAVITNGALLYQPDLRQELAAADAVMPSLDAGTADLYRRINRPHPETTFDRLVDGLIAFRRVYRDKLWPEVMLVRGLNDSEEALQAIAAVLRRVNLDEIHISLPTRPPVETWVEPADAEGVMRAQAILGDVARVLHPAQGQFDLSGCDKPTDAKGESGKSTIIVLLARALAQRGYQVCVLDADSTNVGLHQALGVKSMPRPLLDYFGGMVFSGGAVTCPVGDPTLLTGAEITLDKLPIVTSMNTMHRNITPITAVTTRVVTDLAGDLASATPA